VIQYLSWIQKVKETRQDNNKEMCGKLTVARAEVFAAALPTTVYQYAMDICNIFCFCKNWHAKNKLLQITAPKCWFLYCYDTRNNLSTASTVCDHERETAESTNLPFQIPGLDEIVFTTDLPQVMVSLRQAM